MARKSSVIMSAAERKTAKDDLKVELDEAKHAVKASKEGIKGHDATRKAMVKDLANLEKRMLGIKTRLDALKPPKKA
jgi:uncharacterized membrane protein